MSDARGAWRKVMRLVAVLVAAVQLVVAAAPMLDADAGRAASAHVEAQGVRLHWTHDAAECGSCVARHLATALPAASVPVPVRASAAAPVAVTLVSPVSRLLSTSSPSRAPPSVC